MSKHQQELPIEDNSPTNNSESFLSERTIKKEILDTPRILWEKMSVIQGRAGLGTFDDGNELLQPSA